MQIILFIIQTVKVLSKQMNFTFIVVYGYY